MMDAVKILIVHIYLKIFLAGEVEEKNKKDKQQQIENKSIK